MFKSENCNDDTETKRKTEDEGDSSEVTGSTEVGSGSNLYIIVFVSKNTLTAKKIFGITHKLQIKRVCFIFFYFSSSPSTESIKICMRSSA